jgi:hypothetical protein
MPDTEMIEHVSASRMERFCARGLPETELTTVARHLAHCTKCHRRFVATLGRHRETNPVTFTLAPELWLRHEHIDYEQLVELAENKVDATDRELIDLHLKVCTPCREDVRSFLAFREQIAQELEVSYSPIGQEPTRARLSWVTRWRGLAWKPIYAAAVVVIGIAMIIGVVLLLKRRAGNLQVNQGPTPQVSPVSAPDNRAANVPSPYPTLEESPIGKTNSAKAIVVLNDESGQITVDKRGNISGLDDIPTPTRDEITKVLLSERIELPPVLEELAGQESTLRGGNSGQSFKLIFPTRTVLVPDRPRFKWEQVSRASAYRVYVNDPSGHEVARSEELSSERTEWVVPKPLKRGGIYAWTVIAVVDKKEIVSPGPSSPEMKFQILSDDSLQQLNQLKKARSHLALGVFYARAGLIAEAERELRELVRINPKSKVARTLFHRVGSLRASKR